MCDDLDKLTRLTKTLKRIAEWSHAEDCDGHAPLAECGCYAEHPVDMARRALEDIGEEYDDE